MCKENQIIVDVYCHLCHSSSLFEIENCITLKILGKHMGSLQNLFTRSRICHNIRWHRGEILIGFIGTLVPSILYLFFLSYSKSLLLHSII